MQRPRRGARRAKVSISLDPALLNAVDRYVQRHADMDRSKVMESALQHWYRVRQDEAMVAQFTRPDTIPPREQEGWRKIRRSAANRKLGRPTR